MSKEPLLYAKAGGPPDNYMHLEVFLDGEKLDGVTEANVTEGWLIRIKRDADGNLMLDERKEEVLSERLEGKVELREKMP